MVRGAMTLSLLVACVLVVAAVAWPQTVMAIDLSRLYGHMSSKRNSKCFVWCGTCSASTHPHHLETLLLFYLLPCATNNYMLLTPLLVTFLTEEYISVNVRID